jgi:DNA-directed RNA polymerase subunit RPC12/RpoP
MNRFVVSTECPACGAPLDFNEGSNAVTCGHCRSNLLVTGRKQVLSYYVGPQLDERRAVALAVMAQRNRGLKEFRGTEAQLYFIPYYRMTGQDFGWEQPPPQPRNDEDAQQGGGVPGDEEGWNLLMEDPSTLGSGSVLGAVGKIMGQWLSDPTEKHGDETHAVPFGRDEREVKPESGWQQPPPLARSKQETFYGKGKIVLNDRYVEKNFLACNLGGIGLYSLGIRPAVLKLGLFRKEAVSALGRAVAPSMGIEEAEAVGVKTALNPVLLYREVIGKILSVVYFPFWVVRMESEGGPRETILDGVTETVINADAPLAVSTILGREVEAAPEVTEFRPLTCPNCGWDLPVRPEDCIFFCKGCDRAWEIGGNTLSEVAYEIACVPAGNQGEARFLPFWVFQTKTGDGDVVPFFIPAFRYRRLKFLVDMAISLSMLRPSYTLLDKSGLDLCGCYYDRTDAAALAQFAAAAMATGDAGAVGTLKQDSLSMGGATLTWLPFTVKGEYLIAPFGGISIPKNLLL